jgi:hypothetical protein
MQQKLRRWDPAAAAAENLQSVDFVHTPTAELDPFRLLSMPHAQIKPAPHVMALRLGTYADVVVMRFWDEKILGGQT